MLSKVSLTNFKCFLDEPIPISSLTILSGVNGMGKSSLLQSLLFIRQSIVSRSFDSDKALLNGPLVSFGSADDIFYENCDEGGLLKISLSSLNHEVLNFSFTQGEDNDYLQIYGDVPDSIESCVLAGQDFFYLMAERSGPRASFPNVDSEMAKYNPIGNAGEFTPYLLNRFERHVIGSPTLKHPSEDILELRLQVEAWLSEIGQSPRIHLESYPRMDQVGIEFSFVREGMPSMNYRASNVGFGLTYSLPIFVACLLAKPGSLVLIENPEAHLHPKGQVAMGKFLAKVANAGIQLLVETHSDHILNGIRIAVKKEMIVHDKVSLHFFDRAQGNSHTTIDSPLINSDGRLDHWPEGFFDEWEKGLAELL